MLTYPYIHNLSIWSIWQHHLLQMLTFGTRPEHLETPGTTGKSSQMPKMLQMLTQFEHLAKPWPAMPDRTGRRDSGEHEAIPWEKRPPCIHILAFWQRCQIKIGVESRDFPVVAGNPTKAARMPKRFNSGRLDRA